MTKRHCFVPDVGDAIEALASALDPERKPPFKGDILDLLEWAEKDVLEMCQQLAERDAELKRINRALNDDRVDLTITAAEAITELRQQLAAKQAEVDALMLEYCPSEMSQEQLGNWAAHQRPVEEQGK